MNGKFEMTNEEFDELSTDTQLGALFRQATKNYGLLHEIKETCDMRKNECMSCFLTKDALDVEKKELYRVLSELRKQIKTKTVIEKSIVYGIAAAAGFVASKIEWIVNLFD